jgi:glutaminase
MASTASPSASLLDVGSDDGGSDHAGSISFFFPPMASTASPSASLLDVGSDDGGSDHAGSISSFHVLGLAGGSVGWEKELFESLLAKNNRTTTTVSIPGSALVDEVLEGGLLATDERIRDVIADLNSLESLSAEQVGGVVSRLPAVVIRALTHRLVVPDWLGFSAEVEAMIAEVLAEPDSGAPSEVCLLEGQAADGAFGFAVTTVDGQRGGWGQSRDPITVQSCVMPVLYLLALEEKGSEVVHRRVGREPSGRSFKDLALNEHNAPHNPFTNAGALVSLGFIGAELDLADRFDSICRAFARLSGGSKPGFSNLLYQRERVNSPRNRAIAFMLREKCAFPNGGKDMESCLELWFMGCNIVMDVEALSVVCATLANGGVCPITGEAVMSVESVRNCLSIMHSCPMYDFSGEFSWACGVPAKSSASGILMVVVPGVLGFATYSQNLNSMGISVRGLDLCKRFIRRFAFHGFDMAVFASNRTGSRSARLESGQIDILGRLAASDAEDPHEARAPTEEELTYALYAAADGDAAALSCLLARGISVDACDYDRRSLLHLAASGGHLEVVDILLNLGASTGVRDLHGNTPLDDAVRTAHHNVAELIEGGASFAAAVDSEETRGDASHPSHTHPQVWHAFCALRSSPTCARKEGAVPLGALIDSLEAFGISTADNRVAQALSAALGTVPEAASPRVKSFSRAGSAVPVAAAISPVRRSGSVGPAGGSPGKGEPSHSTAAAASHPSPLDRERTLDFSEFAELLAAEPIILRALQGRLAIPRFPRFREALRTIFSSTPAPKVLGGDVARYIPQLARVNPDQWALSVCTVDGQVCSFGDADVEFCMQSCSKIFAYLLAMELEGPEEVHRHVGKEPSGRRFNDLSLDRHSRPHNPCINAGAIAVASLLFKGRAIGERFAGISEVFARAAGTPRVAYSHATYLSESATADRNNTLAYMMEEAGVFPPGTDVQETLQLYFQMCSVEVTCKQMAVMAATLANYGVCPVTDRKVYSSENVRYAMPVMMSSGMYDYSGEWAHQMGCAAKSGVGGSVLIVIPGVMGICAWSPRLDQIGNSKWAIQVAMALAARFTIHQYSFIAAQRLENPCHFESDERRAALSALIAAAVKNDVKVVMSLVSQGVDVNLGDYDGRTALHLAAATGSAAAAMCLVRAGARPDVKDTWGMTPLDEARKNGHQNIISMLSSKVSSFVKNIKTAISMKNKLRLPEQK